MTYKWNQDRAAFPVLKVGGTCRHRRIGLVVITARFPNPGGGVRYRIAQAGKTLGEQNDFALLNQLILPKRQHQLSLF